ncbi:glutamate-rich protein 3 [Apus apus]|uniref:glutamate-rich protein 3 n=1 Tax=Apus apus TaxID=8895 RepID=UPI0021F88EF6|nr:glutamate-rich protein 3 [Apus apus]
MSRPQPGFLATYNSLTDKHLVGYFSNTRIRRHLQKSGLISRSGRIIPEKEYRLNAMRKDQQQQVQECLARAIFHKVLDMERHHQLEIKRKLENSLRKERVQKIKVEHTRKSVGGAIPSCSPHPPPGPGNLQGLHPPVAGAAAPFPARAPGAADGGGHPSHQHPAKQPAFPALTSWRPRTAPGIPPRPLRLQPLRSGAAAPSPAGSGLQGRQLGTGGSRQLGTGVSRQLGTGVSRQLGTGGSRQLGTGGSRQLGTGGEPAARYRGEPAARYRGEPAARYRGEPAARYRGEPAARHRGEPAARYRGEPAARHRGEPAARYRGEPAAQGERSGLRHRNCVEYVTGISPYQLPIISNPVAPAPPPPLPKGDRSRNAVRSGMLRGRWFRPTTAPNDLEQLLTKGSGGPPKASFRSNAFVTMVFLGKSVHLSHDDADYRDEIKVYQQHCGGENLCVYKGKLLEGETFQFVSKRHHGFPFSLTFFLNGILVDRLSWCCEYKHQKRSRLGGRRGHFGFLSVEGAAPCYRCIIAMGLDKKPSPPKRKIEAQEEKHVGSWRDGEHSEPSASSDEQKPSKESVLVILPIHEVSVETVEDTMETGLECRGEERKNLSDRESEDGQEDNGKNEYDEDFEADEDSNEEGQTGDQMNGRSKSISDDKNPNSDHEKEGTNSSRNVLPASDSEKDESDECSDIDSEDDKEGRRPARSLSPGCSGEDESPSDTMTEGVKDKEEQHVQRAPGNAARARHGNEDREEKLLRMEEIQETLALEKEGKDEAEKAKPEDVTAGEDSGIFPENRVAIQYQSPEGSGELQQAGSAESNTGEDGEKNASTRRDDGVESLPVALESSVTEVEDSSEEAPGQAGAPDGAFLAEGTRTLDVQKAAEQVVREGQMAGERQALEKEGSVAEGRAAGSTEAGGETGQAGEVLPREEAVSVLQALEEPAPEESSVAGGDPQGDGTGKGMESGTAGAPEEQEVLVEARDSEAALGELAPGGEELAVTLGSREAGGAVSEGDEEAGEDSEGEEAAEEISEAALGAVGASEVEEAAGETVSGGEEAVEGGKGVVVGETVSGGEEAVEEGGSAGRGVVVEAVSGAEEAVEDANLSEGIAGLAGPEEAVDEAISEGKDTVEKPGALLEALWDTSACTGEAVPAGEDTIKPNEFSQLNASGEELMEMEKAATGAATSEAGEAPEVEVTSLLRAEDAVEETVGPVKGSVLQEAPGLEALVGAGVDPVSEESSQLEKTTTVEEEGGSAEALLSGNPSLGSKAKAESPREGGEERSVSVETARAGSGGQEEVLAGAAGPREPAAGVGELLEGAEESGRERLGGEGLAAGGLAAGGLAVGDVGGSAPLLALWLSVSRGAARPKRGREGGSGCLGECREQFWGQGAEEGQSCRREPRCPGICRPEPQELWVPRGCCGTRHCCHAPSTAPGWGRKCLLSLFCSSFSATFTQMAIDLLAQVGMFTPSFYSTTICHVSLEQPLGVQ